MAVGNSLKAKRSETTRVMSYEVAGAKVELTPDVVKKYLVSGNKDRVTTQEIVMFMNLCKYSGLNPWLKEAYCIKYGNEPATMVVGKEAFMKKMLMKDWADAVVLQNIRFCLFCWCRN